MNTNKPESRAMALNADELAQVHGGVAVLEKQGLLPRKLGDSDLLVYVDGVLIGTTYGSVSGGSFGSGGLGGPFQGDINGRPYP